MRRIVLLALLAACAPTVAGPVERQAAADRLDAARLGAQLGALPGVVRAEVILRTAVRDPLATAPAAPASASMVIVVDDRADRTQITASARLLTRAIAPEVEPAIVVEVGAERALLARVGPFRVEASSKPALKGTLAVVLALIAALAGWVAWIYRRGNSAQ